MLEGADFAESPRLAQKTALDRRSAAGNRAGARHWRCRVGENGAYAGKD